MAGRVGPIYYQEWFGYLRAIIIVCVIFWIEVDGGWEVGKVGAIHVAFVL
jgi:hypothetical protein